jgi:hypothetical protein
MRRILSLILMLVLTLGFTRQVRAQSGVEWNDVGVEYMFGEQVTFKAQITSPSPVQNVTIFFRDEKQENTRSLPATVDENGQVSYRFDTADNLLRPFARILFWFQADLQDGQVYTSSEFNFRYTDNRFPWQTKQEGPLSVHWYDGDTTFGQAILDAARTSLQKASSLLPLNQSSPLEVYVYASADDLQGALFLGGETWVAGHADPTLGVVLVSVAPGPEQSIRIEQQVPHELTHVLLYRQTGNGYDNLPTWLSEGIASTMELYPSPDYAQALQVASQNQSLIPMSDLCTSFPPDAGSAFLAYAQSEAFVRYLNDTYGTPGLQNLISAYASGLDCEQGARSALGVSLTQLDRQWQKNSLNQNPVWKSMKQLTPFLVILAAVLLLPILGLSNLIWMKKDESEQPI